MTLFYHVTTKGKVPYILKKGLLMSHKKNVPLSKQVNYVMSDLVQAGQFASQMRWSMETEVAILEIKDLDTQKLTQDSNIGAYDTWLEYHDDIPVSKIKRVINCDSQFWKEHVKRMSDEMQQHKQVTINL